MTVKLLNSSHLQRNELLSVDGVEFWDLASFPEIPESSLDTYYTIKGGDRPDSLSYAMYGDTHLWWVIALANNLDLMPSDLVVGTTIRIPAKQTVQTGSNNAGR